MLKEYAYAKVNLYLKVVGKKDEYHMLDTLMAKTNLADILYFKKRKDEKINIEGIDIPNNSIYKAALAFKEKYQTSGVDIKIKKIIPTEAGLGGASADSSATLRGLNRLFKLKLSLDELNEIAKDLGSDNTFCLYNKASICLGRGEILAPLDFKFKLKALLIKPPYGLKTKEVFENVVINKDDFSKDEIIKALKEDDIPKLNQLLENDLFVSSIKINKNLAELKEKIESFGSKVHMSGSGSTLFVIDKDVKKLKEIAAKLDDDNDFYYVEIVEE